MSEPQYDEEVTAERFATAAAAVLADLFGEKDPPVAVRWIPPADDDPEFGELRVEAPDGEGFGYTVFARSSDEYLRYQLAERIPEYLPELTVSWAGVFPPCPGHSHPAEPAWDEAQRQAHWRCPRDDRPLARVGSLREERP